MCTVTYIPLQDGFVLTSSRDEKKYRPTIVPKYYRHINSVLIYPRDEVAHGSWIAASQNKKIACLLNGAFNNHVKEDHYAISRGQILLQILDSKLFEIAFIKLKLSTVEPFTLLLIDYKKHLNITQLVWDGEHKHIRNICSTQASIWSSVTLYPEQVREFRQQWFHNWILANCNVVDHNIYDFHTAKHSSIDSQNILMTGENDLQTLSISQIKISYYEQSLLYNDLINNVSTKLNLSELLCRQESL